MYETSVNRIFILPNGIDRGDIQMIALHHYTSLKDLMPESPPSTASPTWREIPMKNPLLQHAAWAYLQPMTSERQSEDGCRWWRRFHSKFWWLVRCFNDVVLVVFEGWLPKHVRERLLIEFESGQRDSVKQGSCRKSGASF